MCSMRQQVDSVGRTDAWHPTCNPRSAIVHRVASSKTLDPATILAYLPEVPCRRRAFEDRTSLPESVPLWPYPLSRTQTCQAVSWWVALQFVLPFVFRYVRQGKRNLVAGLDRRNSKQTTNHLSLVQANRLPRRPATAVWKRAIPPRVATPMVP